MSPGVHFMFMQMVAVLGDDITMEKPEFWGMLTTALKEDDCYLHIMETVRLISIVCAIHQDVFSCLKSPLIRRARLN